MTNIFKNVEMVFPVMKIVSRTAKLFWGRDQIWNFIFGKYLYLRHLINFILSFSRYIIFILEFCYVILRFSRYTRDIEIISEQKYILRILKWNKLNSIKIQ